MNYLSILALIILLSPFHCRAQSDDKSSPNGITSNPKETIIKVEKLFKIIANEIVEKQYNNAVNNALKAENLAQKIQYKKGIAYSHLYLGIINRKDQKFAPSLNNFLQAGKEFFELKDNNQLACVYEEIGLLYDEYDLKEKAIENYLIALDLNKNIKNVSKTIKISRLIAKSYFQIKDYNHSLKYYNAELTAYQNNKNKKAALKALIEISKIYKITHQNEKALKTNLEILDYNKSLKDSSGIILSLNNIGFIYEQLNQKEKSLTYFLASLKLNNKFKGKKTDKEEYLLTTNLLRNIGVLYQKLDDSENALTHLKKALKVEELYQNNTNIAITCNYIASTYYVKKELSEASKFLNKAIEHAKRENAVEVLALSYRLHSQIHQIQKNNKKALEYYHLHALMKDSIQEIKNKKKHEILEKQVAAEKKEKELKTLLFEKEVKNLALKELQLKNEKQQQQFQILLRDKELKEFTLKNDQLKIDQALKELELKQSKLLTEKKEQKIIDLYKDNEIKNLALKQKELEKQQQEKVTKLIAKENEVQSLRLKEEQVKNKFFLISIVGTTLIIILIIIVYINKKRDHSKLARKNSEIEQQKDSLLEKQNKIEEAYKNIELLNEIGKKITSQLSLSLIIDIVYENINAMMDAPEFGIGIYEKDNELITFDHYIYNGKVIPKFSVPLSDVNRLSVHCVTYSTEIIMGNIQEEYKQYVNNLTSYSNGELFNSIICLPLISNKKTFGVISVQSFEKEAYSDYHLNIVRNLAVYTSIALENAQAYEKLDTTLNNFKKTQTKLVQSEKMASLGQLTAGVAHELNNPINYMVSFTRTVNSHLNKIKDVLKVYETIDKSNINEKLIELTKIKEDIKHEGLEFNELISETEELTNGIFDGAKRTNEIVKSLRTFSRLDENDLKLTNVHICIDSTLILLQKEYKDRINIIKEYDQNLPQIESFPGKLNQVFMNILINAMQAIKGNGQINIKTYTKEVNDYKAVVIYISDNGIGIPEEIKQKIFEPFFTTKDVGKGTGLGLSISYGIIKELAGNIEFTSESNKGSEFTIELPLKQS